MRAYVLITTKPGRSEEVVSEIKAGDIGKSIKLADSVYGHYDAVIVIEMNDLKKLMETVYKVIEKNPNIIRTETLISLF